MFRLPQGLGVLGPGALGVPPGRRNAVVDSWAGGCRISTMYTHHSTLYPMLGVGIFFVVFWTGFVLAYEAGLPCIALPLTGLLTGVGSVRFVIGLERLGRGGLPSRGAEGRAVADTFRGSRLADRGAHSRASLTQRVRSEVQRDVAVHRLAFGDQARLLLGEPFLYAQPDVVLDGVFVGRKARQQFIGRARPPRDFLGITLARFGEEARGLLRIR